MYMHVYVHAHVHNIHVYMYTVFGKIYNFWPDVLCIMCGYN